MPEATAHFYEFGDFRLDAAKRLLQRHDGTTVPLPSKAIDTLHFLVEHHDVVLDKERLMEAVWPDSIVEENNLSQSISTLRRALGETPDSHRFIVTVPGRGYRFVAEVRTADHVEALPSEPVHPSQPKVAREDSAAAPPTRSGGYPIAPIAIALAVLLLATGGFFWWRTSTRQSAAQLPVSTAANRVPDKSIAVLPFENLSGDPENAFFTAGVQDEILSDLAKIAALKVISRTSANLYKSGSPRNAREIGQQLGVAHLLEGSVQRSGNRIRINAQLVDARTDAHVWAHSYDRDLADIFATQSEIAQTIADQLQARISPAEKAFIEESPTANMAAFDSYTRGAALINNARMNRTEKEDLLQGIVLLENATSNDPKFFLAYCKLAEAHDRLYRAGTDHTPERLAAADSAVRSAVRLRPDSGESHFARALHLYSQGLHDAAREEVALMRRTLPNDVRCFALVANIDKEEGHWTDFVENLRRSLEVDPRNTELLYQITWGYESLRDYQQEAATLDKVLSLEPDNLEASIHRAQVEISWRADTRPLRTVIDTQIARNPAMSRKLAPIRVYLALCERDANAADLAATDLSNDNTWGPGPLQFNREFTQGLIAGMQGDTPKAQAAFSAAYLIQERIVQAQPDYAPALCMQGLIEAALGRKAEALRDGRRAAELNLSIDGTVILDFLAVIYAWAGERDLAVDQMQKMIQLPGLTGYGQLKLLPFFDPLRGDPRFEKLVANLAPKD